MKRTHFLIIMLLILGVVLSLRPSDQNSASNINLITDRNSEIYKNIQPQISSFYGPVGQYDSPGTAYGITIDYPYVYLADGEDGLRCVNITIPTDGASFVEGTSIGFNGQATADGGGDLTAQLVWTSDRDGQIGAGGSFSSILSLGTHRITASVTDLIGNQGSQDIMITVTEDTGSPILFESLCLR